MRFSELEQSRVAILGAGREGQAVWRQLRRRFPKKPLGLFSESDIEEKFRLQLDPAIDQVHIGALDVTRLEVFDVLVRSAGISIYREELRELRSRGCEFTSASNLWFAENPDAKAICISGTLGKSTTASLTALLLSHAGINACLAGNIGRPMLDCDEENVNWWVIELSSYQISDLDAKPAIVVLLNISEEHLDWHRGFENYRSDKLRLARMAADGQVIANHSNNVLREDLKDCPGITWFNKKGGWQALTDRVFRESGESGLSTHEHEQVRAPASLPGEHNMQNLAAALTVVDALGLEIPRVDEVLASYHGLPHRLQFVGEKRGVRYINDSISTTPVSVTAALQTIGMRGVILLLGGMDRGLDWTDFARRIAVDAPYAIITLPENGQRLFDCLNVAGVKPKGGLHLVSGLEEAVLLAEKLVPEDGCILLSPGAPSYPHFQNYEDRGLQFIRYSGL